MIASPFETRSDSFYFVDDRLVMHNKADYAYDGGMDVWTWPQCCAYFSVSVWIFAAHFLLEQYGIGLAMLTITQNTANTLRKMRIFSNLNLTRPSRRTIVDNNNISGEERLHTNCILKTLQSPQIHTREHKQHKHPQKHKSPFLPYVLFGCKRENTQTQTLPHTHPCLPQSASFPILINMRESAKKHHTSWNTIFIWYIYSVFSSAIRIYFMCL